MNKLIKKQLEKCKINLPYYDENTDSLLISKINYKYEEEEPILLLDHYYIIKLEYYIVNPPAGFTLSSNWNKGITPKSGFLLGTPTKAVGKMIQWDCCGYDIIKRVALDDTYKDLWLPVKGFTIIEEYR